VLLFDDQVEDFSKLEFGEQRLLHFLYQDIHQMGRDGRIRKLFFTKTLTCDATFSVTVENIPKRSQICFSFFFLFFNLK
jgi:hypothetical protein